METFRLKNIAILILLLLNAGLLALIGSQRWQSQRAASETAHQLEALCAASQLALDSGLQLDQQPLSSLAISRHDETERVIASYLLGGSAVSSSQGGGIYSYSSDKGSIQFRSGGSFDGSRLEVTVDDITAFSEKFCSEFGYRDMTLDVRGGSGSMTAVQEVAGVTVYGCTAALYFDNGVLTGVTGAHVSLENAGVESAGRIDCVTALVRFLDYRNATGIVCSEVTDIQCVYLLQAAAATVRLLPVWRIETDTNPYFVDCATGAVSRS